MNKKILTGLLVTLIAGSLAYMINHYNILFNHDLGIENLFKIAAIYSVIFIIFYYTKNGSKAES